MSGCIYIANLLLFDPGLPPVGTGFMTSGVLFFENEADQKFVDIVSTWGLQKMLCFEISGVDMLSRGLSEIILSTRYSLTLIYRGFILGFTTI